MSMIEYKTRTSTRYRKVK